MFPSAAGNRPAGLLHLSPAGWRPTSVSVSVCCRESSRWPAAPVAAPSARRTVTAMAERADAAGRKTHVTPAARARSRDLGDPERTTQTQQVCFSVVGGNRFVWLAGVFGAHYQQFQNPICTQQSPKNIVTKKTIQYQFQNPICTQQSPKNIETKN